MLAVRVFRRGAMMVAAIAISALTAVPAQASSTPAQSPSTGVNVGAAPLSADQVIQETAHILATRGLAGIEGQSALTLHRTARAGAVAPNAAAATITCTGTSTTGIYTFGGIHYIHGRGVTHCPVPVTNVVAETSLWEWSASAGGYLFVFNGYPAEGPGMDAVSTTPDWPCPIDTTGTYVAITYHFAQQGSATGSARTASFPGYCTFS